MEQTCIDQGSDETFTLEALTAKHFATARYGITRHRMADDSYHRVTELLNYTGLMFHEADAIAKRLDAEAREAAGNPTFSWGLTMHNPKLETPLPSRWKSS